MVIEGSLKEDEKFGEGFDWNVNDEDKIER